MSRISKDECGLRTAEVWALRSTCLRRHVGAVLTDARGHVLSTGYNGVASGMRHCNDEHIFVASSVGGDAHYSHTYPHACPGASAQSGTLLDSCHAIHAEQNALLQCRDCYAIDTAYVTASPCMTCVKMLMGTSCRRIVFRDKYSHGDAPMKLWLDSKIGREWIHLERTDGGRE